MAIIKEQEEIVSMRDNNIIVSASAGSGKTTVMIRRIVDLVINDSVSVEELLVLTYTRAAAGEMKQRLIKKMSELVDEKPYLREQIENINQENLIINNKKNKYKIKNISEEFILDEKYNRYYEVVLETKIEQDLIINNNIINISIELPKETFFQKLIKKIKKGMKQWKK